jgi:hypothetical protein
MNRLGLLVVALLLAVPATHARGEASGAMAGHVPEGQGAMLIGFEQSSALPWALVPIPIHRPTFRMEFNGGLPDGMGVHLEGAIGGVSSPVWRAAGGPRFAPLDTSHDVRPAVTLLGGLRSVPGAPEIWDFMCVGCNSDATHDGVLLTGAEGVFEFVKPGRITSFLLRVRYEAHWILATDRYHGVYTRSSSRPQFASHMWELRLGVVANPRKPSSAFVELGGFFYQPEQESEMDAHGGLIFAGGAVIGPRH